ncbi:ferrous iron transporter B [Peptoniphilus sp. KCTC 25270]|uniref:ferrous iron transporter B n=1 Tax=Peptoniphilus sp. KCTC 25270 TaxID=2897414 RepID=UPI001E4463C0|nr:ferrous iron transporter B [Peptoniphilus sp. KCTC 25270]MCD1147323.1 ferrous iron transporter B [Peptoniphilus sp. KCTC 25270]
MKIALTGNPNSGKTTLFNGITGSIEHVGNWAGVTVEKKEGTLKKNLNPNDENIVVVDLPGAYSMSPFTSEESITRDFVQNENPDVIINIVDATNLSRSLFFTTQLLELNIPVVVALNKSDLVEKKGNSIDVELLSKELGCPVIETVSVQGGDNGHKELIEAAKSSVGKGQVALLDSSQVDYADKNSVEEMDKARFEAVKSIVEKVEKREVFSNQENKQDSLDRILAHPWLGIPIFAVVMWAVFSISQTYVGPFVADFLVGKIDQFYAFVEGAMGDSVSPILSTLLLDGIIGGVGAVVGFLPLIMVLFFLLALLEDSGYLARVALIMDRFFKRVGLSGKSIIPMIIGTGCAIPGVMATRTIKDETQRRTTAMLTPFMPCGAKLPVIALFAGVFFKEAAWVGTSMYFLAIILIVISALIIRKITGEDKVKNYFIMELPEYRIPSVKRAFISMMDRAKAFIIKAATIILICNVLVQIMQMYNWSFQVVAEGAESTSILASIAHPFAILLVPLGFGAWQLAAAAITGFIAKENVVGTLAVVYGVTNFIDTEELSLVSGASSVEEVMGLTAAAALAYLAFNLFTPPCFAAIGAMNAEMESKKWVFGAIGFQLSMGYVVAFLIYQIGTLVQTGSIGVGFVPGLIAVLCIIGFIGYLMNKGSKKTA